MIDYHVDDNQRNEPIYIIKDTKQEYDIDIFSTIEK